MFDILDNYPFTIVTLSNGKRVANFSSPHDFQYEDGTVLPAHDADTAKALEVTFVENIINEDNGDTELSFKLSIDVIEVMRSWKSLYKRRLVDVVVCPLPMITALKDIKANIKDSPFRAIRVKDRIKKLVSIDQQTL
jgi:hypothetical protein